MKLHTHCTGATQIFRARSYYATQSRSHVCHTRKVLSASVTMSPRRCLPLPSQIQMHHRLYTSHVLCMRHEDFMYCTRVTRTACVVYASRELVHASRGLHVLCMRHEDFMYCTRVTRTACVVYASRELVHASRGLHVLCMRHEDCMCCACVTRTLCTVHWS
jgi:hypothetical protein